MPTWAHFSLTAGMGTGQKMNQGDLKPLSCYPSRWTRNSSCTIFGHLSIREKLVLNQVLATLSSCQWCVQSSWHSVRLLGSIRCALMRQNTFKHRREAVCCISLHTVVTMSDEHFLLSMHLKSGCLKDLLNSLVSASAIIVWMICCLGFSWPALLTSSPLPRVFTLCIFFQPWNHNNFPECCFQSNMVCLTWPSKPPPCCWSSSIFSAASLCRAGAQFSLSSPFFFFC